MLCNDKKTTVEITQIDSKNIYVLYNGKTYQRPKSHIGKTLHYLTHCWFCKTQISPILCKQCKHCRGNICPSCGSCYKDRCVFALRGFTQLGIHRNGTRFSDDGYDVDGFDKHGYDKDGYGRTGFNRKGLDKDGYDRTGYDKNGYDRKGFNRAGFNENGYDKDGFNRAGFKDGYDRNGFNLAGFDKDGYNKDGYNKDGYDRMGYDAAGYDKRGFNRRGFDKEGYSRSGFDENGFNRQGDHKSGLTKEWMDLIGAEVVYKNQPCTIKNCVLKDGLHLVTIETSPLQFERCFFENTVAAGILIVKEKPKKIPKKPKWNSTDIF